MNANESAKNVRPPRVPVLEKRSSQLARFIRRMTSVHWSSVRRLARNRTVRSAYFWLIFVPISARMLATVNQTVTLTFLGGDWALALELPFSWKIFYLSAVAFSIGNLIFTLACPKIILDQATYTEFSADGKSSGQVVDYYAEILQSLPRKPHLWRNLDIWEFAQMYLPKSRQMMQKVREQYESGDVSIAFLPGVLNQYRTEIPQELLADAFWFTRKRADSSRPQLGRACGVFYGLGLALISIVLIQNFVFVVAQFF